MGKIASDTFSWICLEVEEAEGREPGVTVDFADILAVTTPTAEAQCEADGVSREALLGRDVDACDGILADERLEDAEWVNWSDAKRELRRQD